MVDAKALVLACLTVSLCAGCAPPPGPAGPAPVRSVAPDAPLNGGRWELVAIRSMDDRVLAPGEPGLYTLSFEGDGRLTVRADCNRGRGTWSSAGPGQVRLGPLATTRAMCAPGSFHERFLSELGYVRSYRHEGGRLFLATLADGSIIELRPWRG